MTESGSGNEEFSVPRLAYGIIDQMFISTADEDYVCARMAFRQGLFRNFLWLSLHAIEKYFKAALLLNGRSARRYAHDLVKLDSELRRVDDRLAQPGRFDARFHVEETRDNFLSRWNQLGSANNRYMQHGFGVIDGDLDKVDQIIWSARRYCGMAFEDNDGSIRRLALSPQEWKHDPPGFLEKLTLPHASNELRQAAFDRNFAFAPDFDHTPPRRCRRVIRPQISFLLDLLSGARNRRDDTGAALEALEWCLSNIDFGADEKVLRAEIEQRTAEVR